ncbi:DoxX family protein [Mangrovactinospora gilvigrisea]|uniref:DoxX family protein n=1 Tax=Mangrovactinospora gilvigrisea TaxID=1428644 RepID=UPI000B254397|nr:DoxX family protein [Mangrovactinospora gilvigrisea]
MPEARTRAAALGYWAATLFVTSELAVGGGWDIARLPMVARVTEHLGYPGYFLVLLGIWKILGAAVLLAPRLPLLKEWAYAGTVFVDSGAVVSHLVKGYQLAELGYLLPLLAATGASWALRPPARRSPRPRQIS